MNMNARIWCGTASSQRPLRVTGRLLCAVAVSTLAVGQQPVESHLRDDALAPPRPLNAGGGAIRSADQYAAPAVGDVNGDGVPDLLVGDFGQMHGAMGLPSNLDLSDVMGAPGQVRIYLGRKVDGGLEFGAGRWASALDGKVQSPTW